MVHAFVVVLSQSFSVLLKKSLMLKFPVPVAALLLLVPVPPPPLVLTVTPNQHFSPVTNQQVYSLAGNHCSHNIIHINWFINKYECLAIGFKLFALESNRTECQQHQDEEMSGLCAHVASGHYTRVSSVSPAYCCSAQLATVSLKWIIDERASDQLCRPMCQVIN